MGTSSSKLKSKPSKFFKRASFRRKKKEAKQEPQAVPVTQNGSTANFVLPASQNGTAVPEQTTVEPHSTNGTTPTHEYINISTVAESVALNGNGSIPATPLIAPKQQNGKHQSTKEKSRSLAGLVHLRRTGSVKSTKSTGSTFSLRRFGSLKSIGRGRRSKKSKNNHEDVGAEFEYLDPAEIPPEECHFVKLYEPKLHLKIFKYFSLDEKLQIRSVCRKWQTDLFKEQVHFKYPLFHVKASRSSDYISVQQYQEESRQALVSANKYLYWCPGVQSLKITERLTRTLIDNLTKYCFSKNLNRLEFTVANMDKCDIIAQQTLEQFSLKFGKQLREIAVDASVPNGAINNDLTDVILFLLYTNSEHFENLVNFHLKISNKLTNGYFQMFQSEFGSQLRELSVEAHFDTHSNTFQAEATKTLERIGSTMDNLKSLKISLLPRCAAANPDEALVDKQKIQIYDLANLIGKLSQTIANVESFTLAINLAEIECEDLDLIKPLSRFSNATNLSLIVYGDLKQVDESKLTLNFAHLKQNTNLQNLTLDSAKISDSDVEQLVRYCPNIRKLTLACDVRVTLTSIYQITNSLRQLTDLKITQSYGSVRYPTDRNTSEPLATKEALFIDNESLILLLTSAPVTMPLLRNVTLENCRIDMENVKVLELFISFAMVEPDERFTISLAHNRFPLIVVPKFYRKYEEYIPKNLRLCWS